MGEGQISPLSQMRDYEPKGDKAERLISQIDLFEGGSVLLPKDAPWLEAFVAELLSFSGRHKDWVDALTQGLAWWREPWKPPLVQRRTTGLGGNILARLSETGFVNS